MSTAACSSSSHRAWNEKIKYDVFMSFRGEDTRSNFTSHLHSALCRAKVKAFIDEDDLRKGNEISPALLKAIKESKLCLVILSEDYASSRWCLEELAHILRWKKMDGQAEVLPIFFKVDPSDVRKQEGSYAVAFAELEKRFENEKLQVRREALIKVADLSGWASKEFRNSTICLSRDDLQGLVGVTRRIEEIKLLLHIGLLEVRVVGIWGVGGIGKTTLARVVFNQLYSQFEACSFLENIREGSKKYEPDHFKIKLFSELLETERPHRVTQFEKDRLRRKKVLIVFDDVDDPEQLEQLFGDSWFSPESRVIVTSRDQQVLKNIGVSGIYQVEELNYFEALELFSRHAFKRSSPTVNKEEISKRIVNYTRGIPLALIVLGRHLYSKSIEEWESTLEKLQNIPDKKIQRVLRISYDSLDDTEKDIFLDIAFFFKGENRDLAEKVLDGCGLFAAAGISVLIDKALITVSEDLNEIQMHDLIQMMAFEIVRPQSNDQDPRKGSRLRIADDIDHAIKHDRGIETIKGRSLDTSNCNQKIRLYPTTFLKMRELRLLKISGSNLCLPQGPLAFPDTLRYLYWRGYPLKSLSTNFIAEMLVAVDMCGSQLEELWKGAPHLDKLKFFDLSGSKHLTQVPDLSQAPNIKRVNLELCESLIEVPPYFQHLNNLEELYLIGCSSLCELSGLPKNLRILKVLTQPVDGRQHQDKTSCVLCRNNRTSWFPKFYFSPKLGRFPKILEPMEFIKTLKLDFSAIKEIPQTIRNLTVLETLSVIFCQNLELLPDSIRSLSSLKKFDIAFCRKLESLPVLPSSLLFLDARGCTSLKMMSSSIPLVKQNWNNLYNRGYKREELRFLGCKMLDNNACKILVDEALFRILRFATLLHKYGAGNYTSMPINSEIYWPESKIPRWFVHQNEGCSISINLPHPNQWYNRSYLGLASCVIIEFNKIVMPIPSWLYFYWDSVYMFPNGDSWRQRRLVRFDLSYRYRICGFNECCNTDLSHKYILDLKNSDYVLVYMDNAYGEFLTSNSGQFDSIGNKFPRSAVDYRRDDEFGKYLKAEEGIFYGNGIAGFTTGTATASFSFNLAKESKEFAKIKKCGVHLLYAQEAERFGYVEQIEFESNRCEAAHSESNKKEDEEEDGRESESSGDESINPESEQEEGVGCESESSGGESINPELDQEEDDGNESESNQIEHDEPPCIIGCWGGFRWLLERFCFFRNGGCWNC